MQIKNAARNPLTNPRGHFIVVTLERILRESYALRGRSRHYKNQRQGRRGVHSDPRQREPLTGCEAASQGEESKVASEPDR